MSRRNVSLENGAYFGFEIKEDSLLGFVMRLKTDALIYKEQKKFIHSSIIPNSNPILVFPCTIERTRWRIHLLRPTSIFFLE